MNNEPVRNNKLMIQVKETKKIVEECKKKIMIVEVIKQIHVN